VVKKLLRSLDSSFDTLALMIQERPDYKSLDPADILERLNTHEFQQAEKRDMYGPSYGRPRALKAKAKTKAISSSEEEEEYESSSDGAEEIGRELAMLVKKFQKFSKKNRFGKSSKYDSKNTGEASARDYNKRTCHKCKKPGHYIADCPLWQKKKKSRDDDESDGKRRNPQSLHQSPQSLHQSPHLTRSLVLAKLVHSLGRRWILKKNLMISQLRNLRRSQTLVWQALLSPLSTSASPSSTLRIMVSPPTMMTVLKTSLPPIASWHEVQR
jgi:hypothetical protein